MPKTFDFKGHGPSAARQAQARQTLAAMHRQMRRAGYSPLRLAVRTWYDQHFGRPLRPFREVWRCVPACGYHLRTNGIAETVQPMPRTVLIVIVSFFVVHLSDDEMVDEYVQAFDRARRKLRRAKTRAQEANDALTAVSSKNAVDSDLVRVLEEREAHFAKGTRSSLREFERRIGARRDVFAYALAQLLVKAAGFTHADAHVLVAQIEGLFFDTHTEYSVGDDTRRGAPAIERRIARLLDSSDRELCRPWDDLLQTTLNVPPPPRA